MKKSLLAIIVVVVVLVAAGLVGWWYMDSRNDADEKVTEETTGKATDMNGAKEDNDSVVDIMDKAKETASTYQDLEPAEAQALVDDNGDAVIIDVSPKYTEGHLLNSINYYVGDGSLDTAIPSLDKEKTYLVYCHVDSASILGAKKLTEAGFTKVYRLKGNYSAWVDAGYSVITDVSKSDSALSGDLTAVDGSTSTGQGYVLRDNDRLEHLVTAAMPEPGAGKFYEGWLVNQTTNDFFSTGPMFQTPEGEWRLEYVSGQSYTGYNFVVITLETKDDGQPEDHVIEGKVN